jgi:hypothetical protein
MRSFLWQSVYPRTSLIGERERADPGELKSQVHTGTFSGTGKVSARKMLFVVYITGSCSFVKP